MDGDNFNYPPGILHAESWAQQFFSSTRSLRFLITAVQQEAVMAERRSRARTLEEIAANNRAWADGYLIT